jgi:hypothetical protein
MNAPTANDRNEAGADQAYARLKAELDALRAADLQRLNVDALRASQRALSVLPGLRALSADLSKVLPTFDQRLFDKLEDCALALAAAHARHAAADAEGGDPWHVLKQATNLRTVLMSDATALSRRGYLKQSALGRVKGLSGYENTARDLSTLSAVLRRALPTIRGKSAVTVADIELAADLGAQLRRLVELSKRPSRRAAGAEDERVRVFTLLFRTYTEVRRTIGYLRAEQGDAEMLMPPLCGRASRPSA